MHRRNYGWFLPLLLLLSFIIAAPAALAAEGDSSSSDASTSTSSVLSSSSREEQSSSPSKASSEASSETGSAEGSSSSFAPMDLALRSFTILEGSGQDDVTSLFRLDGNRITGTVPFEVTSISVKAEATVAAATIEYKFNSEGLSIVSVGTNPNCVEIKISYLGTTVVYYVSVNRRENEFSDSSVQASSQGTSSQQSVVDWNSDGISDASAPSFGEDSSGAASSSEESSSGASSKPAVIEGTDEGGHWMLPSAIALIVLGVLGIAFVVCDILYTKGILKKWILPRRGDAAKAAEKPDAPGPDDPPPTEDENWDDFFKDR